MKVWCGFLILALAAVLAGCASQTGEEAEVQESTALENGSFFAELNGFNIHYEVHGKGPVVMAVTNSWGFDAGGLRSVLGLLEERVTMVYFDPRGMGQSDPVREDADMGMAAVRADFDALRGHLGLEKVHAIGWSNGAMNLILLAGEKPDSLESAIFLHGAASYTEEDWQRFAQEYPELMAKFQELQTFLKSSDMTDDEKNAHMAKVWVEEYFPMSCAAKDAAKPMLIEAFRNAQFSWRHSDYTNQDNGGMFDARDTLSSIPARSLILAGVHDSFPVSKAEEMRDGMPNAELVVFENSGHFAPLEEPEAFKEAVFRFLGV